MGVELGMCRRLGTLCSESEDGVWKQGKGLSMPRARNSGQGHCFYSSRHLCGAVALWSNVCAPGPITWEGVFAG